MDKYIKQNLDLWNELTPIHAGSALYDVNGFKKGKCTLKSIELEEIGDVNGESLLHLQCHFGLDTLSWARFGAKVTGVDFSHRSIVLARTLSKTIGIDSKFICCSIYDLPRKLDEQFDIVFTSRGVLCWLPDLKEWAKVIAHFLKPGGFFYIFESHPMALVFSNSKGIKGYKVTQSYFHSPEPIRWEPSVDYADPDANVTRGSNEWTHSLSDIINALIGAKLNIEFIHEFPVCFYQASPLMKKDKSGWWRVKGDKIPQTFSIKAIKRPLNYDPRA